jgi:Arc/MetJ-type ribon-helix-helix transcriptional regulator
MIHSSEKRQISIAVDAQLLDEIDKLTTEPLGGNLSDHSQVVEDALRLWRTQKIKDQLIQFYQNRSQGDIEIEEDWSEATQDSAIAAWDRESP